MWFPLAEGMFQFVMRWEDFGASLFFSSSQTLQGTLSGWFLGNTNQVPWSQRNATSYGVFFGKDGICAICEELLWTEGPFKMLGSCSFANIRHERKPSSWALWSLTWSHQTVQQQILSFSPHSSWLSLPQFVLLWAGGYTLGTRAHHSGERDPAGTDWRVLKRWSGLEPCEVRVWRELSHKLVNFFLNSWLHFTEKCQFLGPIRTN